MTTFNTQQQHSGNSLLGPSVPQSFIDTYILYKYLESSIAAKQAALEIRFNQTCDHQDENTEPDKWRAEFSLLADQYDLDLIQEALAAIVQHSAMRDYSNIPMRIPLTDNALKMVSNCLNQEFETVPFTKDMLTGNTYMPSIVGVHVQSNTALMGSVGAFATMDAVSIQKLKKQMMAAALILPDCFVQRDILKRIDTVYLALIDTSNETNGLNKHFWPFKHIDVLLCVSGAAEAIQDMRDALQESVRALLNRADKKLRPIENITTPDEQPEAMKRAKVRVDFLEFQPCETG